MASNLLLIASIAFCIYLAHCYYQDVQVSQADLQPRNLRISRAAESYVIGKKKNGTQMFGGTVHIFQFEDGEFRKVPTSWRETSSADISHWG